MILLASNEPSISRLNSNIVHNGDYINLRRDELYRNGTYLSTRDVIEHVGSIVAVPYEIVDEQVFIYMVKQWRNPVSEWVLEFPAGTLDHNENPNLAVKRELQEEIGMIPGDIKLWSHFFVAPGWCTEKIYCFIVTDLKKSKLNSDIDEEIYVEKISFHDIEAKIEQKEIIDLKTIASFYVFKEFFNKNLVPK